MLWFFLFFSSFLAEMTGIDILVGDLVELVSLLVLAMMLSKLLNRSELNLVGSELVRNCE